MKFVKTTTMSAKRIVISLAIYLLVPVLRLVLTPITHSETLSLMLALNLSAWILLIYDWELFGLHWNRAKSALADSILYAVIGFIFFFFWTLFNAAYLNGKMLLPDATILHSFPFAIPPVLFAYSISLSVIINISFKCITDRFKVYAREAAMILMSGFVFGLIYTITMTPVRLPFLLQTYLYNMITITALSYLYNQTHSFVPGMAALAAVLLIWQLVFVL